MSILLRSYLKPLASDYLNSSDPELKDEVALKVANIVFILSYGKWEPRILTKLLAQFDLMTANEMKCKIKDALGPEEFNLMNKKITNYALKVRDYADKCRRDNQSIVLRWAAIYKNHT